MKIMAFFLMSALWCLVASSGDTHEPENQGVFAEITAVNSFSLMGVVEYVYP